MKSSSLCLFFYERLDSPPHYIALHVPGESGLSKEFLRVSSMHVRTPPTTYIHTYIHLAHSLAHEIGCIGLAWLVIRSTGSPAEGWIGLDWM